MAAAAVSPAIPIAPTAKSEPFVLESVSSNLASDGNSVPLTPAPLLLLQSGPGHPALNMAVDEALLETANIFDSAVLRFYAWAEPAASFGYFQRYSDVERLTPLRPLVRRPTGGGIVPHDCDWTYSVVFPPTHTWYSFSAIESYRQIHEWLQRAFARINVPTRLAPVSRKAEAGQCFAGYEQFDLLWRGQKIAGAAQRRTKQGLLIQGSIQPPPLSLQREAWHSAMLDSASIETGSNWKNLTLSVALKNRAEELARSKYSQASYNQKR
jgi:lipoate-protein ligase A